LAALAAAPLLPVTLQANPQQATPTVPAQPEDPLQKAHEQVRGVGERLRKVEIPMDLEPAFVFRP
jgi:hypothetical protein